MASSDGFDSIQSWSTADQRIGKFPPFGEMGERLLKPGTTYDFWYDGSTATVSLDDEVVMRCRFGDEWVEG